MRRFSGHGSVHAESGGLTVPPVGPDPARSAAAGPFLTTLYVAVLPHCGASLVPAGAAFLPQGLPREACAHVGEMSFVS